MNIPRIYVACLSSLKDGRLFGEWIDANQPPECIQEDINRMLKGSPIAGAEEWIILSYEGFAGYVVGEQERPEHVSEVARFLVEHGGLAASVLDFTDTLEEAREAIEDRYEGCYDSLEDYAENAFGDVVEDLPVCLRPYFDFDAYARDLQLSGEIFTVRNYLGIHVFRAS